MSTDTTWSLYAACAAIEGFDGEEHTEDEILEAYQYLINTGEVWQLQGAYGRAARDLIERGLCTPGHRTAS